jgi:hypothetical protein
MYPWGERFKIGRKALSSDLVGCVGIKKLLAILFFAKPGNELLCIRTGDPIHELGGGGEFILVGVILRNGLYAILVEEDGVALH